MNTRIFTDQELAVRLNQPTDLDIDVLHEDCAHICKKISEAQDCPPAEYSIRADGIISLIHNSLVSTSLDTKVKDLPIQVTVVVNPKEAHDFENKVRILKSKEPSFLQPMQINYYLNSEAVKELNVFSYYGSWYDYENKLSHNMSDTKDLKAIINKVLVLNPYTNMLEEDRLALFEEYTCRLSEGWQILEADKQHVEQLLGLVEQN